MWIEVSILITLSSRQKLDSFYERPTMAPKRYHDGGSKVSHHKESFNDEWRHDKGSAPRGEFSGMHEPYAGADARRTQEMQDAGMIRENPAAIANLPQEVMIKAYPKTGPYLPEVLEDTIKGVDAQMDQDDSQRRKHFFPKKTS